jgi:hypothetical protein
MGNGVTGQGFYGIRHEASRLANKRYVHILLETLSCIIP